jgi:hypothetical protein
VLTALAIGTPIAALAIEEALTRVASVRAPHASRLEISGHDLKLEPQERAP